MRASTIFQILLAIYQLNLSLILRNRLSAELPGDLLCPNPAYPRINTLDRKHEVELPDIDNLIFKLEHRHGEKRVLSRRQLVGTNDQKRDKKEEHQA